MMPVGTGHPVSLTGGFISLGPWGQIEVSGATCAKLETSSGHDVELPSNFARHVGTTVFWLDELDGQLLLIPRIADEILQIDLRHGIVHELEWLVRDEDEDLRFVSVRSGPGGTLLMLYERGLLCLDADGTVRWHALHDDLSAEIISIDSDHVILQQQWPRELAGRIRRYTLSSGELQP